LTGLAYSPDSGGAELADDQPDAEPEPVADADTTADPQPERPQPERPQPDPPPAPRTDGYDPLAAWSPSRSLLLD
jgi:hypothetical protein